MLLRCSKCEIKLESEEPWSFPGGADDLNIIHTPGHTYGHIVLLHKPSKCVQAFPCLHYRCIPMARLSQHWYYTAVDLLYAALQRMNRTSPVEHHNAWSSDCEWHATSLLSSQGVTHRTLFTGDHMSFSREATGAFRFSKVCPTLAPQQCKAADSRMQVCR